MNKKYSYANEQQQRQKLGKSNHGDRPSALTDAANVDHYEEAIHNEHHDNSHHGTAKERNDQSHGVCQHVHDPGNRTECREKIKHASEKSDVAPKCHFDIRVKAAG